MKTSHFYGAIVALITFAAAEATKGVVRFDMRRMNRQPPSNRTVSNSTILRPVRFPHDSTPGGAYYIDIGVGTPPQTISVALDSGSSDTWVPLGDAPACKAGTCPGGNFFPEASSTFRNQSDWPVFKIGYKDKSGVVGYYMKENIQIGAAKLKEFAMGVGVSMKNRQLTHIDDQFGIMGLGFSTAETASCQERITQDCFSSPVIYDALFSAGYIGSRSYSVYFDDINGKMGSILFGGIDMSKFHGDLTPLAICTKVTLDKRDRFTLSLTGVSIKSDRITTNASSLDFPQPTVLDTGAGALGLPYSVYAQVLEDLEPFRHEDYYPIMYCQERNTDYKITIELGGQSPSKTVSIDIALRELLVPVYDKFNGSTPMTKDGKPLCQLLVEPGKLIGDPFFRSAYVHFNLDSREISIAQASYNTTGSNVIAIGEGKLPKFSEPSDIKPATHRLTSRASTAAPSVVAQAIGSFIGISVCIGVVFGLAMCCVDFANDYY